jgi:hypothetical protein
MRTCNKEGLQKEATLRILLSCHCILGCNFREDRQMTDGGAPISHEGMGLENEEWRSC